MYPFKGFSIKNGFWKTIIWFLIKFLLLQIELRLSGGAEEQVLGAHGMEEGSLRRPWEVGMSELLDPLAAPPADNLLVSLASKS